MEFKQRIMEAHSGQHSITLMARVLSVSRSGLYVWRKRIEPGPRALTQANLVMDRLS